MPCHLSDAQRGKHQDIVWQEKTIDNFSTLDISDASKYESTKTENKNWRFNFQLRNSSHCAEN